MAVTKGIAGVVVHPQWGVPMGFHILSRADFDFLNKGTYVTLASYYSKEVLEAGGTPMHNVTVQLEGATLADEAGLLTAVTTDSKSALKSGVVTTYTVAGA